MKHDWEKEDYDEYRKEVVRKSQKFRREIARGNGLCIICCKEPARKHMATCLNCSTRISRRAKERREAKKEQVND